MIKQNIPKSFVNTIKQNKNKVSNNKSKKNLLLNIDNSLSQTTLSQDKIQEFIHEDNRIIKLINDRFKLNINSVYDLVNKQYIFSDELILFLVKLLDETDNIDIKEGLIRALTFKNASKYAAKKIIEEFLSINDENYQWVCGNALGTMINKQNEKHLLLIAKDKSFGQSRQMIIANLWQCELSPKVVDLLIQLLKEPDVCGHAIEALKKIKSKRTRPYLELFLDYPITWIRNNAKKAIQSIDKNGTEKF